MKSLLVRNSSKRKLVLFDTCFLLASLMKAGSKTSKALFQILSLGYTPILTSTIVKELDRKMWNISRNINSKTCLEWTESVWNSIEVVDDDRAGIKSSSKTIPTHFPDNLHIAAAKSRNAIIISLDRKLVKTAQEIGAPASDPVSFVSSISRK